LRKADLETIQDFHLELRNTLLDRLINLMIIKEIPETDEEGDLESSLPIVYTPNDMQGITPWRLVGYEGGYFIGRNEDNPSETEDIPTLWVSTDALIDYLQVQESLG